ncbi:leucine-rich repeat receptor-like serine/threonine/tyrosine-protein kinase SOBIR1 [Typha angustifolia]|uniref:leucine-rich repeat receptor-like serine/threonine/tyrosine-protein kinase SOBIR1 n=1 Tax=Typha angustifolia TaxID=59011 RepID=UPI003C2D1C2B
MALFPLSRSLLLLSFLGFISPVQFSPSHALRRPISNPINYPSLSRLSRLSSVSNGIPKHGYRYLLAQNFTKHHNSTTNSTTNSITTTTHGHKTHRQHVRDWILSFVAGSLGGTVSGFLVSVLFRLVLNCARRRYKTPAGPSIFSRKIIHNANDLSFLEKEDGVTSLQTIGRGGCGEVYKAELPNSPGKMIAIKRIKKRTPDGAEPTEEESRLLDKWTRQIRSEILTVGHIRHRNLLPLLAHVSRPDCHYLIYEFMKNGSLHEVLMEVSSGRRELDWPTRHKIAIGIASGLEHLHVHHKPRIIHRDLKPANILLDDSMEARISDFGLAKEMPEAHSHMTSSNVAGTIGYIAPEYYQTLKFTPKCDMYSLGVILAVLVVGKLPSDDFFQNTEEMSLVKWLRNMMKSPDAPLAVDPKLGGNGFEEQMLMVLRIACLCTADNPKERPTSRDVRIMLFRACPSSTWVTGWHLASREDSY